MKVLKRTLSMILISAFVICIFTITVFAATTKNVNLDFIGTDAYIVKNVDKTAGRDSLILDNRTGSDLGATPYFDLVIPAGYGNSAALTIDIKYTVENFLGINKYHTSERVYSAAISNNTSQSVTRTLAFSHRQSIKNQLYFDTDKTGNMKMYVVCDTNDTGINFLNFKMYFRVTY